MIYKNKLISITLFIIYVLSLLPVVSLAEESEAILFENFETENDLWTGGTFDEGCAYEGKYGMQISNPFGEEDTAVFGHILEYNDTITLKEGVVYTFSAYVLNPLASDTREGAASAYLGRNGEALFIDIDSVGDSFTFVTASFMATEDAECKPIISLSGGDIDMGFFIDDISITTETRVPEYTVIEGPKSMYIPDRGFTDYRYSIVTYDTDDNPVNILLEDYNFAMTNVPEGVEFDGASGMVRVHSTANPDTTVTISVTSSEALPVKNPEFTALLTKNLLADASFEEGMEKWVSEDEITYADGSLSLYASTDGMYGKYTTISYTDQLFLMEDEMYVFKADVRSDEEFPSSSVYISNLSFAQSGYAEINITGIGGDWNQVTSAFCIEDTGLYDLTLNLYAPSERPIYIDNVYLAIEDEAPTTVSIHAPGNIAVPSEATVLPCFAYVLDQMGNAMDNYKPNLSISPTNQGVYLEDGEIIVESNAHLGNYIITATYENITSKLEISISDNLVGDGSFEIKQANEWWTASDGSVFSIIDYNGEKAGHVYSPDPSCMVMNNSYMELLGGEYYVYSASPGVGEGIVTALIADAYTGEYVPFAQYDPTEDTLIPFMVDQTVTGRLALYIESETEVGLIIDNIEIFPAELSASEITISGGDYGEYLRGTYTYINNMTNEPDSDISSTRWYISSTYDGHYEPIGVPNQNYLEFTPDMAGQYVIFEVTPICAYTGLVSESLSSLPMLIASDIDQNEKDELPLSEMTPVELDNVKEHPFYDITDHWAENMVAALSEKGVISGKTKTMFYPEHLVTRAEFTTMIVRAFSLVSLPYSGNFKDVDESYWAAGYIEAAYRRGIITGTSETEFDPNGYITREQMATIIARAYKLAEGPMPYDLPLRYDDTHMISSWSYDAVKTGTNLNLFEGKEMNLFKPLDHATRAEAAAVLYRTLKCF